jgi:hypothetical protein
MVCVTPRMTQANNWPEVGDADGADARVCSRPTRHRDDIRNLAGINLVQMPQWRTHRDQTKKKEQKHTTALIELSGAPRPSGGTAFHRTVSQPRARRGAEQGIIVKEKWDGAASGLRDWETDLLKGGEAVDGERVGLHGAAVEQWITCMCQIRRRARRCLARDGVPERRWPYHTMPCLSPKSKSHAHPAYVVSLTMLYIYRQAIQVWFWFKFQVRR